MTWRERLAGSLAESYNYEAEPKFDPEDREGVDALKEADYVEIDKFKDPVLAALKDNQKIAGYFCATCKYYVHDDSKKFEGYCQKLKAEDAAWGCCNYWELNESGEIKEPE